MMITVQSGDCGVFQTETDLDVVQDPSGPMLRVITVNRGPSVMYEVCARMEGPFGKEATLVRPELGVGETNRVSFRLNSEIKSRGVFPIVVWTDFRDEDRLPVTLCSVTAWPEPDRDEPVLTVDCPGISLNRMGTLACDISNPDDTARTVAARLIVPGDLAVENDSQTFHLAAFETETVDFSIMNRFGSPGEKPGVYLVLEYDLKGRHHCRVERFDIFIGDQNQEKKTMGRILVIVTIIMGLVWLGSMMVEHRSKA